jgi:hypothetical protein
VSVTRLLVPDCQLLISRAALVEMLGPMGKFLRKDIRQEAILDPAPGGLEVSLGGIAIVVAGEGSWTQRVRVPGRYFVGIARRPPSGDPIEIAVVGERCKIGSVSLPCEMSPAEGANVELTMDPFAGEVLALRQQHTSGVIEKSGLLPELKAAEERRDRLLVRALEVLAPLGVTEGDLRWAIERAVRRRAPRRQAEGQVVLFKDPEEPRKKR